LSACGFARPDVVDRADEIAVAGGTCRIEWWLAGLSDEATDEAWRVARAALKESTVSPKEFESWMDMLTNLDDTEWSSETELAGAVHREAVRADVRSALADAGYPDENRVIETYSSTRCAPTP
jgi:hypothetical protein